MNLLKQHWDKAIVSLSLLLLVTTSLLSGLREANYSPDISLATVREKTVNFENQNTDFSDISQKFESFSAWVEPSITGHRLAVSRQIEFLPEFGRLKPYDLKATDRYGIDREWKIRYGLSLADPFLGIIDSDGDGFLNLDEFRAKTDPTNPASRPEFITKLRIIESEKIPFRMIFRAYNEVDGRLQYQINLRDAKDRRNRSPQVATNDVVEEWKVGEFRRKVEIRFDPAIQVEREFDESELDLEHTVTREKVTLVLNKEVDSPESVLSLRDLSAGPFSEIIKARVSRDFNLRGVLYKLLETKGEGNNVTATVEDIATGARHALRTPEDHEVEWINRSQQQQKSDSTPENSTEFLF